MSEGADGVFDYAVIGSGIGGLTIAALLAQSGKRVVVYERHSIPGGYGHTFKSGRFSFCAELHYLWDCGPGQWVFQLFAKLGLEHVVRFRLLDTTGYDRVIAPGIDYLVGCGFDRERARLSVLFPGHSDGLRQYFTIISKIAEQANRLPIGYSWRTVSAHPLQYSYIIRYVGWTVQDLLDLLGFPEPLRLILTGQSLIFGLPPNRLSLLAHAAGVCSYNSGAYVPEQSFAQVIEALVGSIEQCPGCEIRLSTEVDRILVSDGLARAIATNRGDTVMVDNVIFDGDPQLTLDLIDRKVLPAWFQKKLNYRYGMSALTVYLGIEGIPLRSLGFGEQSIYVHPSTDLNAAYDIQCADGIPDEPLYCCDSPTLRMSDPRLAPPDCHQIVVAAPCRYDYFHQLRNRSEDEYLQIKEQYASRLVEMLEQRLVPGLSKHIVTQVIRSPLTNERIFHAPRGNCYGMPLDPQHVNLHRLNYRTPFENLHFVGASSSMPGFAAIVHFTCLLYEKLTGDRYFSR